MQSRLVIGCGSVGHALVESMHDRPGELLVLEQNARRVERLREEGVTATTVERVDAATIRANADDADTVVVAADDTDANIVAARAAREVFPDAMVLAYVGLVATDEQVDRLADLSDRLVDPREATTSALLERIGPAGTKVRQLRRAFRAIEEPLAIVAHDNPDPDAIASAVALRRIASSFGVDSRICYYGQISHQENRAFINLLEYELTQLEADADLEEFGGFALVDHSRPGVNDQLPPDTPVDIVIDHHPPRAPVDARFVDLRGDVGATSTLLAEYLRKLDLGLDEAVATGLLFGIRVDTKDFSREVSTDDFEAAAYLLPEADVSTLERIESPSISGDTFETIAAAIRNRELHGTVATSYVGELRDRDALAQAADRLLDLEGVTTTVVYGLKEGVIYVSGRARGTDLDLGETLRDAFDQIGSAGGHADMAGAQIQIADTTLDPKSETEAEAADGEAAGDGAAGTGADEPAGEAGASAEAGADGASAGAAAVPEAGAESGDADAEAGDEDEDRAGAVTAVDFAADMEAFINGRLFEALEARPARETIGPYASSEYPEDETDW